MCSWFILAARQGIHSFLTWTENACLSILGLWHLMPSCDYTRRMDSPVIAPVTSPREQSLGRDTNPSKITEEEGSRERQLGLQGSSGGLAAGCAHMLYGCRKNSSVANGPFASQRRQYKVVYFLFKSCYNCSPYLSMECLSACVPSALFTLTLYLTLFGHSFIHLFISSLVLHAWTVSGPVLGTGNTRRNGNYFFKGFSVLCPVEANTSKHIIRMLLEKCV